MFACENCRITGRFFLAVAARDALHLRIVVGIKKEWHGIAFFVRSIDNSMGCCPVDIVGPASHKLSKVDVISFVYGCK